MAKEKVIQMSRTLEEMNQRAETANCDLEVEFIFTMGENYDNGPLMEVGRFVARYIPKENK